MSQQQSNMRNDPLYMLYSLGVHSSIGLDLHETLLPRLSMRCVDYTLLAVSLVPKICRDSGRIERLVKGLGSVSGVAL